MDIGSIIKQRFFHPAALAEDCTRTVILDMYFQFTYLLERCVKS
jgi:hypothetical protein